MEFSVRIDSKHGVVRAVAAGALTRIGTQQMVAAARAAGRTHGGMPILYDLREALPGEVAKSDLFWMARDSPALRDGHAMMRIATLFRADHGAIARFWENAYRNAGINARAFESEDEALAWLRE